MNTLSREQLSDIMYKHLGNMVDEIEKAFGGSLEAVPSDEMSNTEDRIFNDLQEYLFRCMDYAMED